MWRILRKIFRNLNFNRFSYLFTHKYVSLFSLIDNSSKIQRNTIINRGVKIISSSIDNYTYVAPNSVVSHALIGKFCSISSNVKIGMGIHPTDLISTSPIFYAKDNPLRERLTDPTKIQEHKQTIIGNDVWIGVDALIMDGIRIGNGAIIGAKALVVKDVPAYAIVGGIPAHIIRYRFDENTIKLLEETQWWSLPISTLKTKVELFNKESFTKEDLQTLLK